MKYINKNFYIEKVKIENLAKRFDTPIYCYSYKKLKSNILNFKENFPIPKLRYFCNVSK